MSAQVLTDAAARREALDVRASIILQAPAGSGKTTILTQRFLALLCTVEQPEEILAITFTRKAAAEMRSRIVAALAATIRPDPKIDAATLALAEAAYRHSIAQGWQLERNPVRLRIMTIDGLNRSIAMATPVASGGAGMLEVARFPQRLHLLAARRCLEDAEEDPQMQAHATRIFMHLDNQWSRAERLLAQMLATRSQWLPYLVGTSTERLQHAVESSLRDFCQRLVQRVELQLGADALDEARALLRYALENLRRDATEANSPLTVSLESALHEGVGEVAQRLALLQGVADLTLTREGAWRRRITKSQGFPPAGKSAQPGQPQPAQWKSRITDWIDARAADSALLQDMIDVQTMPALTLDATAIDVIDSLIALLRYAAAQLELAFVEQREVDYVGVAVAARQAVQGLEGASDLVIHQGERLRHLLIDEFQDTSVEQFEFIGSLVQGWREGDGRTLFVVGDPMQSIYRFREADVGLFMRAREYGIASLSLRFLELKHNFRSSPLVVDFVNRVFARVFPDSYDAVEAAIPYLPSEAATSATDTIRSEVRCHWFECEAARESPSDRRRQVSRVLEIVREVRAQKADAKIAILVHSRAQARPIVARLQEAGIAVQGVDLVPLHESPVVEDLLALTRALLWPDDRIAWLAVLRAPWCGMTLADLHALTHGDTHSTIGELWREQGRLEVLSPEGRSRMDRVRAVLEAHGSFVHGDLARQVERCWHALSAACVYPDAGALEDARRYLDVLTTLVGKRARPTREDLEWMLQDLYSASAGSGEHAVQVMTIHGAKGLEFDCVILPALSAIGRPDTPPLLDWISWEGGSTQSLLLAPVSAADAQASSRLSALVRRLHKRRDHREAARVLYVAATRAKASLHLLGAVCTDGAGHLPNRARSPLGILWSGLATQDREQVEAMLPDDAELAAAAPGLRRLPLQWQPPAVAQDLPIERLGLISAELAARVEDGDTPVAPPDSMRRQSIDASAETARAIGICIHRELEGWIRHRRMPRQSAALVHERPRIRALLQAEGVGSADLDAAADSVAEGLRSVLEDDRGRWILATHSGFDAVELELTGRYEGRISNVVIDRCFVEEGTRWVIDYKSARFDGADPERFIAEQSELYRPQLERYVHFARRLGTEPVRAALYFVFLGRFVELEFR